MLALGEMISLKPRQIFMLVWIARAESTDPCDWIFMITPAVPLVRIPTAQSLALNTHISYNFSKPTDEQKFAQYNEHG